MITQDDIDAMAPNWYEKGYSYHSDGKSRWYQNGTKIILIVKKVSGVVTYFGQDFSEEYSYCESLILEEVIKYLE